MVVELLGVPFAILGIVLSTLATVVIGALWYSDALFGRKWQDLSGVNKNAQSGRMLVPLTLNILSALMRAIILNVVVVYAYTFQALANFAALFGGDSGNIYSPVAVSLFVSALAWFGFAAPALSMHPTWGVTRKKLFLVEGVYELIVYLAIGLIIGLFLNGYNGLSL